MDTTQPEAAPEATPAPFDSRDIVVAAGALMTSVGASGGDVLRGAMVCGLILLYIGLLHPLLSGVVSTLARRR